MSGVKYPKITTLVHSGVCFEATICGCFIFVPFFFLLLFVFLFFPKAKSKTKHSTKPSTYWYKSQSHRSIGKYLIILLRAPIFHTRLTEKARVKQGGNFPGHKGQAILSHSEGGRKLWWSTRNKSFPPLLTRRVSLRLPRD